MSIGLKGNTDGSGAIQVGGSDAITIDTGLVVTMNGGVQRPLISGTAVASTSGTSIDFTGVPSWVKRVTVMFTGVSTSGTSNIQIQLGTGVTPTYTTTGYLGAIVANGTTSVQFTAGIGVNTAAAANLLNGTCVICNLTGNTWAASTMVALSNAASATVGGSSIPLGATLTAVRVTTANGTDTFDAGSINILYE